MNACRRFRRRLEEMLAARGASEARRELGWHEHLLGCSGCRDLLEAEDALDLLLASLPEPALPPFLTERVLLRLRSEDSDLVRVERRLDALLELDAGPAVPPGLARRVQAGLRAREEAALDRLLDAAGEVAVPPGLPGRVRDRLEPALALERRRRRVRAVRVFTLRALAAGVLAVAGLWLSDRLDRGEEASTDDARVAQRSELPEEGLLEVLPALELMALLEQGGEAGQDPSLLLGAGLDEADLALAELNETELGEDLWPGGGR